MALPNSQHFSPKAGFQPNSANSKPKRRTYAQALTTGTKVSLLHSHIVEPDVEDDSRIKTLQSRIFRTSQTKGAFLLDITDVKKQYTDQQCMFVLKKQHPNVHACLALSDESRRYLEIYIDHDKDENDLANVGLTFEECNLQIFPNKSLDDNAKLLKLKLSNLPMYNKQTVLEGLKKSLAIFGEIMDIGIITEPATGFFMGSGYAVLNQSQTANTPKEEQYSSLNHLISWCESSSEIFRAT